MDEMKEGVEKVKGMLRSMNDGEMSTSAYDTAWVGLVKAIDGSGKPQFPESLEWISRNQLQDGSWGDVTFFQPHDRLLNTLACVIALTSWNLHPQISLKGMKFMRENMRKLVEEKEEHMLVGFEVIFPTLLEMAQRLGIQLLLDDSRVIAQQIFTKRSKKLSRIPKEIMHKKPTTLLFSLEGVQGDLDWQQLMKLQSKNGSFLYSPASTAYALMHTNDVRCLNYLQTLVRKFNGGVPFSYPIDLFEHIWAVDRLNRLGISRYFESEIRACLDYVYRYWTEDGIFSARDSEVPEIDDTCMGFRLLRLHGYDVSPDVLKHFKNSDGEFLCFPGQSTDPGVTVMLNLYRASQVQYPGETILEEAKDFSFKFLQRKQASNQLFDKWVIPKDLPGEVAYAMDLPWYASLPRIESRFYIDQYGGGEDAWIGKTLYRIPNVSNNLYLELAKLDYNACQTIHLLEWQSLKRWHIEYNVGEFSLRESQLLRLYFVAAASVFEPERSAQRLAWAKTWALTTAIAAHSRKQSWVSYEQRRVFVDQFLNSYYNNINTSYGFGSRGQGLVGLLLGTLNQVYLDVLVAHAVDIRPHLRQYWEKWMVKWAEEGDEYKGLAELAALTILACSINTNNSDLELQKEDYFVGNYNLVLEAANKICHQLGHLILQNHNCNRTNPEELVNSHDWQRLLQLALSNDPGMKRTVLTVARAYYYSAYCSPETIDSHIAKLMFQSVD